MPELSLPDDAPGLRWSRRSVLLAGGLLLTGCGGPDKPVIESKDYDGYGSGLSRLRPIFERRAKALMEKDEKAYLADLDQSNKDLIAQQKLVFANMSQFEFAEIRYVLNDMQERAEKGGTWFTPVIRIAKLTADEGPGDIAPGETFRYWVTKDGDKDVIGNIVPVTLADREAGPLADAPWHTDKLKVLKVGDSVWLAGDESVPDLDEYAAVTNRELAKVEKLWGDRETFPGNVLFFTRDMNNFKQWFSGGELSPSGKAVGMQIPQLGVGKDGSVYFGKYAASRVTVNLASHEAAKSSPSLTIRHELAHSVTSRASLAAMSDSLRPATWAVEGFARYVQTLDEPGYAATVRSQVASGVRTGKFRGTTPDNKDFYRDSSFNYALGSTVFSLAERLKGRDAAVELYAQVVKQSEIGVTFEAFAGIAERVLGTGSFASRWKSYVRNGG